jgi:hypothetical protein
MSAMNPAIETILDQFKQLDPQEQKQLVTQLMSQAQQTRASENPWMETAGSLVDDPFYGEYIAAIEEYRQSQDQQLESDDQSLDTSAA